MVEPGKCPQCGKAVPSDTPQGLCPACLLRRGLETNTIGDTGGASGARWTPPGAAELAPLFPELDIIELIGRGGMGAVYKAREKQLDRLVALKILPPEIGREDSLAKIAKDFAQRFAREAQAMAKLSHPNIVTIYSFGSRELENQGTGTSAANSAASEPVPVPLYFFIMEYVDGLSLRQLLDRGRISPKEALAIVPQICDALQYAHDRGIVHRDIKPENILLSRAGQVKIADFGLAKLIGHGVSGTGVSPVSATAVPAVDETTHGRDAHATHGQDVHATHGQDVHATQEVMGTPQYMAPEQIERPGEVDHRADIYSLGVVFYQMLTGELPVGRFEPPSRKVVIDVRLDEVVLRALEREPSRRYQQVSQIKTQVETIVTTEDQRQSIRAGAVGLSKVPVHPAIYGWEYRSKTTLFGLPLVHVAEGPDPTTGKPREARGIIAYGVKAKGVIAIGGQAMGVIAFGGIAVGIVSVGGLSLGLLSFGGLVAGAFSAYGGVALGPFAVGGIAAGFYSQGGLNLSVQRLDVRWILYASILFYSLMGALLLATVPMAVLSRRCRPGSAAKGQDAHIASSPDNENTARRRFKSAAYLVIVAAAVSAYFAALASSSGSQLLVIGVIIPLFAILVILTILGMKSHNARHRSDAAPLPPATADQVENARQAVNAPAWGLLVVSAIHLGFLAVAVYAGLSSVPSISPADFAFPVILAYGLAILAGNAFTIYAAGRMRELKNYHKATTACIIVMLLPLGSPISLVFGIWALVVLGRREVIEAFAAVRASQPAARRASLVPALWAIMIHAVAFGAILAVLVFVVPKCEATFSDMGMKLSQLTRATIAASHIACEWAFVLFPMFLLLDAGVCLLLQYLGGRRARRWWSAILALMAAVVIATLGMGVGLPYSRMTQAMVRPADTPSPATRRAGSAAPTAAEAETLTCPLEATIYELRLPPEKASQLDAGALTSAAASPAGLAKALAGVGQVRLLYRMDQSVKLSGDRLVIEDRVPAIIASRRTETGSQINTVEYLSVGAVLDIAGTPLADGIDAKLGLEVMAMTGSQAKATTQAASVARKARMSHKGLVHPGKAVVILSADAGAPDADGRAVAYVGRIVLGAPQAAAKPAAPVPAQSLACPLEATVYELHLPPERLGGLDAAALRSAAGGAASLEQALAHLGKAKMLYRIDQSVKLSGDRITIDASVPTVSSIRHTKTGQPIRTMQYHAVGAILNVAGTPQPDGGLSADLGLELSALTDSAVEIGPQLSARVERKIVMAYRGPMKPGVPVVIVSADAVSPDASGQAVAYLARIVLGKPAAATEPAPAKAVTEAEKIAQRWIEAWKNRQWQAAWALMLPSETAGKTLKDAWLAEVPGLISQAQLRADMGDIIDVTPYPPVYSERLGSIGVPVVSCKYMFRLNPPVGAMVNQVMTVLLCEEDGNWGVKSWALSNVQATTQPASGPAQPTTATAKGKDPEVVTELALRVLRAIKEDDLATLKSLSAGSRQGWLEVDWRTPYQQGRIQLVGEPPVGWSQGDLKQGAAEIRRDVLSRNPDAATKVLQTLVQDDWAATLSPVTASQYLVMVFVKTDGGWRFATFDQSKGNLADDLAKHMANIPANLKVLRQLDHSSASQPATQPALYDWQRTDKYVAPDFDAYFPDDAEGGRKLDVVFDTLMTDPRPAGELLAIVRKGLRRTTKHRTLVQAAVGSRYIWGKSPQNPQAVEIMYHAAQPSDRYGTLHYAVYYGLSVLDRKPPNVLRTLADIMMQARDNNVGRISWGCRGQTEELRTYLRAYLQSTDPRVRDLALAVDRHLSGEADYGQWRRSQDEAQARVLYGSQFPAFKKTLSKGGSEERLELLRKALSEPGLLWALDDSFVDAFTACAADRDARVRNEVAVVVGSRWIWRPGDADPNAVELMLKLSHDEDQSVRYNSVYYGLSVVRPRDERVIARLREMLASGRDRNSSGRIEWGLKMTGATGSHPATPR